MRKRLIITLFVLAVIFPFTYGGGNRFARERDGESLLGLVSAETEAEDAFVPVLRFGVFGDAHFWEEGDIVEQRFEKAMGVLYSLSDGSAYKKLDAVLFPGDFVQFGTEALFGVFKGALDKYVRDGTEVISTIGNHEQMENDVDKNNYDVAAARLLDVTGLSVRQHRVINGYHFIDSPLIYSSGFWDDKENLDWLEDELTKAKDDDPDKPVFLLRHVPFKDTVIGDNRYFDDYSFGAWEYDLYAEYPQILAFVAHTHHVFNVPNALHQRDFTSVVSGNLRSGMVGKTAGAGAAGQFLVCEVNAESTVRLRPYDLTNDRFIGEGWLVEYPADKESFKYTDERADQAAVPEFETAAAVTIDSVNAAGAKISFPQAVSREVVYRYRVRLFKGETEVQDYYIPSGYWEVPVPAALTVSISRLKASTDYRVVITAENSYHRSGDTFLESVFTTAAEKEDSDGDPGCKSGLSSVGGVLTLLTTGAALVAAAAKRRLRA